MVKSYRDLLAWQKAMDLVVSVYRATESFPREELFGLSSQVRRAATSIPSNIAEGQGRGSTNEYVHFLRIARGSIQELETQVILSHRLEYFPVTQQDALLSQSAEVSRLISGLIRSLSTNS